MGAITFIAKKMGCVANNGIYNTLLVVNWGLHNDLWLFDGFIDGSMGVSIVMGSTPKWVDGLWHGKPYENVSFRGAPHFRKPPDVDENKVMDNEHLGFSSQMDWPDSFFLLTTSQWFMKHAGVIQWTWEINGLQTFLDWTFICVCELYSDIGTWMADMMKHREMISSIHERILMVTWMGDTVLRRLVHGASKVVTVSAL